MLTIRVQPVEQGDRFSLDLMRLTVPAQILQGATGVEHVLIGDETCQVRLDVIEGTALAGPVRVYCELVSGPGIEAKLVTAQRLIALIRSGRFPHRSAPLSRRARRWMMALRAVDAWRAGASHRQIAGALFGQATANADWDGPSGYLRCRVQRLIRLGETLVRGGYRQLLK
ncbi:DUF2285 domain-containing protein [Nitrospirillum viridazoti]|uniref:DUF2285 domain-containing protein n=1 Tax=Nitrospirillum viridazoti TaxID=3144925 RepID=UPI00068281E8|nr:DUF2285 domain-containing protein [Nitrospirillum amazonense]